MILAPNSSLTKRVLGSDILFVSLALIYAYLTYVSFGNPAILEGAPIPPRSCPAWPWARAGPGTARDGPGGTVYCYCCHADAPLPLLATAVLCVSQTPCAKQRAPQRDRASTEPPAAPPAEQPAPRCTHPLYPPSGRVVTHTRAGFSSGGSQDLAALTRAFSYPETVAVGWAHFIAQDLLVGRFIWVDGVRNKVRTNANHKARRHSERVRGGTARAGAQLRRAAAGGAR